MFDRHKAQFGTHRQNKCLGDVGVTNRANIVPISAIAGVLPATLRAGIGSIANYRNTAHQITGRCRISVYKVVARKRSYYCSSVRHLIF